MSEYALTVRIVRLLRKSFLLSFSKCLQGKFMSDKSEEQAEEFFEMVSRIDAALKELSRKGIATGSPLSLLARTVLLSDQTIEALENTSSTLSKMNRSTIAELELGFFKRRITNVEKEIRKLEKEYRAIKPIVTISPEIQEEVKLIRKRLEEKENQPPIIKELQEKTKILENFLLIDSAQIPVPLFYARLNEQITALKNEMNLRMNTLSKIQDSYEKVLSQQTSFLKWIRYATILLPIAVLFAPLIEIMVRHLLSTV